MKKAIETPKAPAPIGPYSQAIEINDLLFLSGAIAIDPRTGNLVQDSLEDEVHQVMRNLKAVLEAGGAQLQDVVKASIFITDMNDFSRINAVYGSYFEEPFPARETVQVARLPKDVRVEISVIAKKSS
ncbi:MAG: RidA family protein [Bacteroidota bacterium]|nr:RidA family protein [Bacteroidota bacterium]MDX5447274.1 RidA family protein [Bacteroidota bacterium]